MSKSRKTVDLEVLLHIGNKVLAGDGSAEYRRGAITMIETALWEANRYRGYCYLTAEQVPIGEQPGITNDPAGGLIFPDETRRKYA